MPSEWSTTASVSIIIPAASADSWLAPANPSALSPGTELPVSVRRRTEKLRSSMCSSVDAVPETAHSKAESGPTPWKAMPRVSSSTVQRERWGCSSRRTISSP